MQPTEEIINIKCEELTISECLDQSISVLVSTPFMWRMWKAVGAGADATDIDDARTILKEVLNGLDLNDIEIEGLRPLFPIYLDKLMGEPEAGGRKSGILDATTLPMYLLETLRLLKRARDFFKREHGADYEQGEDILAHWKTRRAPLCSRSWTWT